MDAAELSERARRYQTLAAHVTDEQTRQALLDLAEKYEALAQKRGSERPPGTAGGGRRK
jgi:hypothetical protein